MLHRIVCPLIIFVTQTASRDLAAGGNLLVDSHAPGNAFPKCSRVLALLTKACSERFLPAPMNPCP